jgi:hypothetical protein
MGGEQSSTVGDQEATEMGLRDRRSERKEERQSFRRGGTATRFQKIPMVADWLW